VIHLSTKKGKAKPMNVRIDDDENYERIYRLTHAFAEVVQKHEATTLEVFAAVETLKMVMWEADRDD